jgi:uncharacterized protein (DUF486 family)
MNTASTPELKQLLRYYNKLLPEWTFPVFPLIIAAVFKSYAWMAGPIMLKHLTLFPRILVLWLFAAGEYTFMSPTMNAGVEIIGLSEPFLVTIYEIITFVVFIFVNIFIFKRPFETKYYLCFLLLAMAAYVAYMW